MAALNSDIKTFIVQALACFDTPSQVAEAVRGRYGVIVSRQLVEAHDPTKRCSKGLAKRWVTLFEDTREEFRDQAVAIPVANRAYRLRVLNRMVEKAEETGRLSLALQLLEQAARECGDLYGRHSIASGGRPAKRIEVDLVLADRLDSRNNPL